MNILFFLTPKVEVAYLEENFTVRQALEKLEHHRYSSIPILSQNGEYAGTFTEGDMLWYLKEHLGCALQDLEDIPLSDVPRSKEYKCVNVETTMDDLVLAASTQNYVPVIDGKESFIGIVTRRSIVQYLHNKNKDKKSTD